MFRLWFTDRECAADELDVGGAAAAAAAGSRRGRQALHDFPRLAVIDDGNGTGQAETGLPRSPCRPRMIHSGFSRCGQAAAIVRFRRQKVSG
jgi:hypothetical protein